MRAKRLVRLVVSPVATSGLAYALVGFVGGLLWLAASSYLPGALPARLGIAAVASNVTEPANAATGQHVSLQEAIRSVRQFADAPDLALEGGLQEDGTGSSRADLYYLESTAPTLGEDAFTVDARTADVVEATFRGRMAPTDRAVNLTEVGAEAVAADFAQARFAGFERLTLVERLTQIDGRGTVYSYTWRQREPASGAELPVSVSVAVMGRSGQVFWYRGQRDRLQIDPHPAVERERAVETARTWMLAHGQRWDLDEPASVRLQVLYDDAERQQLTWSIVYHAREDGPRTTFRLLVDARTGAVVRAAS